ncbi:mannose-1-phosphate guanylyltransferase/mannose-6-phosphate isomerase [Algicella marina]|uniref:mannose-1-phosphate guanylyltransferase n=1 Tax=Algicella marina TaxID=2683284 RepID=A0A6P1SUG4_9RHOB|nr:mannose-1-phosphate guanylyltransferase/mannose-6-phosphate isomerase [Algicella marina]QHQ34078.1 mannose-1-phosphate guanylyltransferase/mannose-6-phosphate isomerase [Algicella marina]
MITPVILCGGSGTRLWPLSRKSYPKQFSSLVGDDSPFIATCRRLSGPDFDAPVVMTNADFRFLVTDQLAQLGLADARILIEPASRNTAPAILTAALSLADTPDALMLVAPSDHLIGDEAGFRAAVEKGAEAARSGQLVTFGITPTRAETGYGYLELADSPDNGNSQSVRKFVEKPELPRAEEMLAAGNYLWNAGIFLFRVRDILAAFEAKAPDLFAPCKAAWEAASPDLGFFRLGEEAYAEARDVSIDYAVMEKSDNITAVPYGGGWSDLGAWDAILDALHKDESGNATYGSATAVHCENTLLRSEDKGMQLVGLGLKDTIAVAMRDAVLVANLDDAQRVKDVVTILKQRDIPQAVDFPRFHRPWGWYETLCIDTRFQVKRIMVKPGGILSLQSHMHRSEHWVVVAGTARVTVGEEVKLLSENQSVYIPLGAVHRMENPGKVPMYLIEVQTGTYLGEDDIIRYEDVYARA